MTVTDPFADKIAHLKTLLAEKHGLAKGPLQTRLRRLGRRAPRAVRRDIALMAAAEERAGNPKLLRMTDPIQVSAAYDRAVTHLKAIDVADRRRGLLVHVTADLMMKLLIVAVILFCVLYWRGFVGT